MSRNKKCGVVAFILLKNFKTLKQLVKRMFYLCMGSCRVCHLRGGERKTSTIAWQMGLQNCDNIKYKKFLK